MEIAIDKERKNYERRGWQFPLKNYHTKVLELIPKTGKILELGVGDGTFLSLLKNKNFDCTGVELIQENIESARQKGLNIIEHDLNKKLPFDDQVFDIVIALEVLEHLFNYEKTISEIHRALKKNGVAFISVPNSTYWRSQLYLLTKQRMPPEYMGEEGHVIHLSFVQWKEKLSNFFTVKSHATENLVKRLPLPHSIFCRYAFFMCTKD